MFAAHCDAEGRTVLLSTRRITDLRVEPHRVTISFTCWCGHEGQAVDHRSPAPSSGDRTDSPTPRSSAPDTGAFGRPTAVASTTTTAETAHRAPAPAAA